MLKFVLSRVEANPHARFDEAELRSRGASQLEALIETGVLVQGGLSPSVFRQGRRLAVYQRPDGRLEGIDEDDLDFEPVDLDSEELTLWTLDILRFAEMLAVENEVSPEVSELSDRFWYMGACAFQTAVVLALLPDGEAGLSLLRSLGSLLPTRFTKAVVATPTWRPDMAWQRDLEGLGISHAQIDLSTLKLVPALRTTAFKLMQDEPLGLTHHESGLSLSADLRTARLGKQEWSLTFTCGRAIEVMLRALIDGHRDLHQSVILERAESGTSDLVTLFHRTNVIGTLVVPSGPAGVYRLNI